MKIGVYSMAVFHSFNDESFFARGIEYRVKYSKDDLNSVTTYVLLDAIILQ